MITRLSRLAPSLALALLLARAAAAPADAPGASIDWRGTSVTARATTTEAGAAYQFTVTGPDGAVRTRTITEPAGRPYVRTGNALFDGAFALAEVELIEDSVTAITDGAFNDGHPLACDCFETGEKWHYVWTRDVAYSADLGLSYLDPARTRNSLLFKQSGVRPRLTARGVAPVRVVAQDTGSGGSWPVSSDRVVWIHAALDTLNALEGRAAADFGRPLYRIARDTLAQDRAYVYDPRIGLYRGETSFLDWREQNYPAFTATDTRTIAESYALSTNVLHVVALEDAASLATRFREPAAARAYAAQARALRGSINRQFWMPGAGLYASYLLAGVRPWPVATYDLLGESLAVIHGIADAARARSIVSSYPSTAAGPPVIWPEIPGIAIYHNRAIWPFVTAYALKAAIAARAAERTEAYFGSLLRGAALALSNRENFEFLTHDTAFGDGPLSGPVVNSPRQLWSVAAYAGAVIDGLWGVHVGPEAIGIEPHVPVNLAWRLFADQPSLVLKGLSVRGRELAVTLLRPAAAAADGWLEASNVSLNGRRLRGPGIAYAQLRSDRLNEISVELRAVAADSPPPRILAPADPLALTAAEHAALYAPPSPAAPIAHREGASVRLELPLPAAKTTLEVYRDGERLPPPGDAGVFRDLPPDARVTACYSLVQRWPDAGHASLPGPATCVAPADATGTLPVDSPAVNAHGARVSRDPAGRALLEDWGLPSQTLELKLVPRATGLQRLRIGYTKSAAPVNTGITATVKRVTARCGAEPDTERGTLVLAHLGRSGAEGLSTAFLFHATARHACTLLISDGFNMSYLEHFRLYTGGEGGRDGPRNRATISGFDFEFAGAVPSTPSRH